MLNTDYEVFYDLQMDFSSGRTTCILNHMCGMNGNCQPEECQPASTFQQSKNYAEVLHQLCFHIYFNYQEYSNSFQLIVKNSIFAKFCLLFNNINMC